MINSVFDGDSSDGLDGGTEFWRGSGAPENLSGKLH
jgi:hypothetical protein